MDISSEQVSRFQRDGFLIIENIISAARVERIHAAVSRIFQGLYDRDVRPPALRKPISPFGEERRMRWMMHARLVDAAFWELATDATLGQTAARLLQAPAVSIIEDQILVKPGPGAPFVLHQDHTYWGFSTATSTLTCWLALSDMTAEMGPVEVVRGSHLWGLVDRKAGAKETIKSSDDEYLSDLHALNVDRTDLEFVPAIVPRGGGVFFHGLTLHGSRGNTTDRWRRAVALHWAASDCRLDSSKLVEHPYPYIFAGLRSGDPLVNKYMPCVYQTSAG
jgi:phytanoyl-CoA hydroxylase